MKPNLEAIKKEIDEYLETKGVAVFRGYVSELHDQRLVFWDVEKNPDYRAFIDCATTSGARMIIFHSRNFESEMVEDGLERLEDTQMQREERRVFERRLKDLRSFEGFTCLLELVFELDSRFYVFDLRTDWYEEALDMLEQIDDAIPSVSTESEEDDTMGGYFSRN